MSEMGDMKFTTAGDIMKDQEIARLRAAVQDLAKYIWRGDWVKLHPETRLVVGEIMLEKNESFTHCEDCPNPNNCLTECVINSYVNEDVAKIRGEDE